eukprot:GHVL01025788.1.p1 GENE.GHVL01025788.1~~GHVL01025788.1.p1  ORF type:complete len:273 (+),score=39.15 GHVL01025788.1:241-1059(+)
MSLVCKLCDVSDLIYLLSSLHLSKEKEQKVWISGLDSGLRISVESPSRDFTGTAFMPKDIFSSWLPTMIDSSLNVEKMLSLNVLSNVLSIFSHNAMLTMSLSEEELCILLEEDGAMTDCKVRCYEPEEHLSFDFAGTEQVDSLVIVPDRFKESLAEFQDSGESDTKVWISVVPSDDPSPFVMTMQMECTSITSQVALTFSSDNFVLDSYHISQSRRYCYRLACLLWLIKSLSLSSAVKLRFNNSGVLSVQCMRKLDAMRKSWLEFQMAPLIE